MTRKWQPEVTSGTAEQAVPGKTIQDRGYCKLPSVAQPCVTNKKQPQPGETGSRHALAWPLAWPAWPLAWPAWNALRQQQLPGNGHAALEGTKVLNTRVLQTNIHETFNAYQFLVRNM